MKKIEQELLDNPEKYIPIGLYCYKPLRHKSLSGIYKIKTCPFWDRDKNHHEQEDGYCHFLKHGDWESEGIGLLWDQVKECNINYWIDEDDLHFC